MTSENYEYRGTMAEAWNLLRGRQPRWGPAPAPT
jgi:hypothetical protein